jgi:hypothetical protein
MVSIRTALTAGLVAVLVSSCGWMGRSSAPSAGWVDYKGWGPMANLDTPYQPNESQAWRYDEEMRERARHVAEVERARESVWVANAPLREPVASQRTRDRAAVSSTR